MFGLLTNHFSDTIPNGKILVHPSSGNHEVVNELNRQLAYNSLTEDAEEGVPTNLPTLTHIPRMKESIEGHSSDVADKLNALHRLHQDLLDEQDVVFKSAILIKMLGNPYLDRLPIVYIEEEETDEEEDEDEADDLTDPSIQPSIIKRSRYYRRYPWKRHSRNRSKYEPELRYACTPTKEDVFKLLLNLHENRNGKNGKMITFCNRKRPARSIFTNIRFLG